MKNLDLIAGIISDIREAFMLLWGKNKAIAVILAIIFFPFAVLAVAVFIAAIVFYVLFKFVRFAVRTADSAVTKHPRLRFGYVIGSVALTLAIVYLTSGFAGSTGYNPVKSRKDKTELVGVDISAWQADTYAQYTAGAQDFLVARIANGKNVDAYCDLIVQDAIANNKLIGGYFYCADDTWAAYSPEEYAKWCAETVEGYLGKMVFFLDMESLDDSNVVDPDWAERWLNAWYKETGVKPCLYMNQDTAEKNPWSSEVIAKTPLWCANYDGEPTLQDGWNVIMWQHTDTPVDTDRFFGSAEDWMDLTKD